MTTRRFAAGAVPVCLLALVGCTAPTSQSTEATAIASDAIAPVRAVFTMSNDASGNSVLAFSRDEGTLTAAGTTPTGGLGSGDGLGSQGALALAEDGRFLLVVNPGSNDVSSFKVNGTTLTLVSRVSSGGVRPISVAVHEHVVYVLNATSSDVSGLRLDSKGKLTAISGSTRGLSGVGVGPAQVAFSPDGEALVVSEKGTNLIDTFLVDDDGDIGNIWAQPSNGQTPFGFDFTKHGTLVVSEAFGGMPGLGAVSSYSLNADQLVSVSASAPDLQAAPCWVVVTENGKTAYTSNTGTGTVSGYRVTKSGSLSLLDASGVTGVTGAGTKPADMALDRGSYHLYVRDGGTHDITTFNVASTGALTLGSVLSGLPATAVGLVAR